MGTKTLRKYKLLEGVAPHYEPNPDFNAEEPEDVDDNPRHVEYLPGQVVKSVRKLDKIFKGKFKPLDAGDVTDEDRPVRSLEDAVANREDRFLEEDELEGKPELQKLAKGKKVSDKKAEEEEEETEEESGEEPEDVTSGFENAKDGGLQVFKKGEKYFVHEDGEDEPMNGSKKGFTTKKRTQKFVNSNVKDE